jgi:predicted TPR repeat methyltransferase
VSTKDVRRAYDETVAAAYDDDMFSILSDSRALALGQVRAHLPSDRRFRAADVGCGTGLWLSQLRASHPNAELTGLDPSAEMLKLAARRGVQVILDDAGGLERHFAPATLDLISAHFVLTYFPLEQLLSMAWSRLRPGGLLSLANSTKQSLTRVRQLGSALFSVESVEERNPTPHDAAEAIARVEAAGLKVLQSDRLVREVVFDSIPHFQKFALDGGWLVQYEDMLTKGLPLVAKIPGLLPFHDGYDGFVLLARKD